MTLIAGAVLLAAAVVLFLLQPLVSGRRASLHRELDEPTEAESRRRVTLLALRDVEYDYATGKLGDEDYQSLRRELAAEALTALAAVEAESNEGGDATPGLEEDIARLRGGLASGSTCAMCGSGNATESRFCAYCGAALGDTAGGPAAKGAGPDRATPAPETA